MNDGPLAPPGWYPRPGGGQRFWNGEQWGSGANGHADETPTLAYPAPSASVRYPTANQTLRYTPPGWYQNTNGQMQWWDGSTWGQVAQPTYVVHRAVTKSVGLAYLLWFFLGGFAVHRFYLRRAGSALVFLAVWWGGWASLSLGVGIFLVIAGAIWLFADLFLIPGMARTTPV
jgi:TM2 domain-containing membrane protein YozV